MALTFIEPDALWLLALLPLLWLFAWATRRSTSARLSRPRALALLALRSAILAALVLALAGAQAVREVQETAVVFLVDGSDSVAPAQRERALAYINQAIAAADPGDQVAVVAFGADAAVERAPGPPAPLRRLSTALQGARTDIADAIQLGLALLPAEAQKRVVLLSDGGENQGRAAEAARLAALRGVPIEVLQLAEERGPDLAVLGLRAPAEAREGQEIALELAVESGLSGPARLELFADGALVADQELELRPGSESFSVRVPAGEAGFRRFEARLSAPGDSQPLNNRGAAFTRVAGPPRVLLAAGAAERAEPLRAALAAAGLRPEIVAPAQLPADPAALGQYAAVALVDLPSAAVPAPVQRALATYVEDQGGGLIMVGGEDGFGAGGWRRAPLAELLPVELDPPAPEERPDLALALVIDRSGSMAEAAGGGRTKLALAKDAVYQATLGLARADQLGIVAFDDVAVDVLPMQPLPDLLAIEAALGQFDQGGGTNIRSGVARAAEMLAATDARVRHAILLTDGRAESNYADLLAEMRGAGVTISVVALGQGANPNLEDVARSGGGAFYLVRVAGELPRIFLDETVRAANRDIAEGAFTPAVALSAPPVRGLGPLPELLGYNRTAPREAARTLLIAPDGAPLLAVWQRGLGRSLAWTSDLKGQWARSWLGWEVFPRFAAGLVDAVLPPTAGGQLSLELRAEGAEAWVELLVADEAGAPAEAAAIEGRLVGPAGEGAPLSFAQVAPGRYRAIAPADQPGVYLAQVAASGPAGAPLGAASGGLVVSYSPEYAPGRDDAGLLAELAARTGGRVSPPAEALFGPAGQQVGQAREIALPLLWLALALLPLDIALRRLFLRPQALAPLLTRARGLARRPAEAPAGDPAIARLQAARARAAARQPLGERRQGSAAETDLPWPAGQPPAPESPPEAPAPPPAGPPAPPSPPAEDPLAALLAAKSRRKR